MINPAVRGFGFDDDDIDFAAIVVVGRFPAKFNVAGNAVNVAGNAVTVPAISCLEW